MEDKTSPRLKTHYDIVHNEDGTVDVYLMPKPGCSPVHVLYGIKDHDGLADEIDRDFYKLLDSAEAVNPLMYNKLTEEEWR